MTSAGAPAVQVEGLTVVFGRFVAISELSFSVRYGEVRGLIGPNGAGKTTLLDVLTGKSRPRTGRMLLDGTVDLVGMSEVARVHAGIGRKFQKPSVFDALSVYENLDLACRRLPRALAREGGEWGPYKRERIDRLLDTIGLTEQRGAPASTLSHGQKQWLEIGMVMAQEPKLLLLDEPVAGMSDEETARTATLVQALRRPERSIIVVEHDMDFIERVADKVTVLQDGQTLFEGSMVAARQDPRVIEGYIGR